MFSHLLSKFTFVFPFENNSILVQSKTPMFIQYLFLSLVISGLLYACNSVPNDANCIPIVYPNGEESVSKSFESISYEVSASFEEVIGYYNDKLAPTSYWSDNAWRITEVNEGQVVFDCSEPYRSYNQEMGCVLVIKNENETTIETIWFLMENTTAFSCDEALPTISRSDEN